MEFIELGTTAQRALELLSDTGINAKTLYGYMHTGFGGILRHFGEKGISYVDEEMLEAFHLEQRSLLEQGRISYWKWSLIRRSCELLKQCAVTDSVHLPDLRPWNSERNCSEQSIRYDKPTKRQLAEPENIFLLVWTAHKLMGQLGLAERTIRHYTDEGLAVILKKHYDSGTELYSEELISELVANKRLQYEHGLVRRVSYQDLRKAADMLQELHQTGKITLEKLPNWGRRKVNLKNKALLDKLSVYLAENSHFAENTITIVKSASRVFLLELENSGVLSIETASRTDIVTCITQMLKRYSGGLRSALFGIRTFLKFLYETGITSGDFSKSLPEIACPRKTFHEGFTPVELELLLSQPDRTTAWGKRDYAMMILAVQSGLRACDVTSLTFSSIDWRAREIRIVQHKTGQPLILPLVPETGNAIADYLLNGRPKSTLPHLFLCHTGSIRPLKSSSVCARISRYVKEAGIPAEHRGFHSFRRTFATNLLQNEVPIELIQQMLGQTDMDSAKPYLSIDEQGLKQCALPLRFVGNGGAFE